MKLLDRDAGLERRGPRRIDDSGHRSIEVEIELGNAAVVFTELSTQLVTDAGAAFAAAAIDAQEQSRHCYSCRKKVPAQVTAARRVKRSSRHTSRAMHCARHSAASQA